MPNPMDEARRRLLGSSPSPTPQTAPPLSPPQSGGAVDEARRRLLPNYRPSAPALPSVSSTPLASNQPPPLTSSTVQSGWQYPFAGEYPMTQSFGANPQMYSQFGSPGGVPMANIGVDFGVPSNTQIRPVAPGTVDTVGWDPNGWGNYVRVRHDDGSVTQYSHLSDVGVKQGQPVNYDSWLGASGATGYTWGGANGQPAPHLDFTYYPSGFNRDTAYYGATDPMGFFLDSAASPAQPAPVSAPQRGTTTASPYVAAPQQTRTPVQPQRTAPTSANRELWKEGAPEWADWLYRFGAGAVDVFADLPKGIAETADRVGDALAGRPQQIDKETQDNPLFQAGQWLEQQIAPEISPYYNPQYDEKFSAKLAGGLGSTAGYVAPALLSGPIGAIANAGRIPAVFGGIARTLPFVSGALSYSAQLTDEARQAGATPDQIIRAQNTGYLLGALEGVLPDELFGGGVLTRRAGQWASRLAGTADIAAAPWLRRLPAMALAGGAATIEGGAKEAVQEFLQTIGENYSAQQYAGYDPNRALTQGVVDAFTVGGASGAIITALSLLAGVKPNLQNTPPAQPAQTGQPPAIAPVNAPAGTQPVQAVQPPVNAPQVTGQAQATLATRSPVVPPINAPVAPQSPVAQTGNNTPVVSPPTIRVANPNPTQYPLTPQAAQQPVTSPVAPPLTAPSLTAPQVTGAPQSLQTSVASQTAPQATTKKRPTKSSTVPVATPVAKSSKTAPAHFPAIPPHLQSVQSDIENAWEIIPDLLDEELETALADLRNGVTDPAQVEYRPLWEYYIAITEAEIKRRASSAQVVQPPLTEEAAQQSVDDSLPSQAVSPSQSTPSSVTEDVLDDGDDTETMWSENRSSSPETNANQLAADLEASRAFEEFVSLTDAEWDALKAQRTPVQGGLNKLAPQLNTNPVLRPLVTQLQESAIMEKVALETHNPDLLQQAQVQAEEAVAAIERLVNQSTPEPIKTYPTSTDPQIAGAVQATHDLGGDFIFPNSVEELQAALSGVPTSNAQVLFQYTDANGQPVQIVRQPDGALVANTNGQVTELQPASPATVPTQAPPVAVFIDGNGNIVLGGNGQGRVFISSNAPGYFDFVHNIYRTGLVIPLPGDARALLAWRGAIYRAVNIQLEQLTWDLLDLSAPQQLTSRLQYHISNVAPNKAKGLEVLQANWLRLYHRDAFLQFEGIKGNQGAETAIAGPLTNVSKFDSQVQRTIYQAIRNPKNWDDSLSSLWNNRVETFMAENKIPPLPAPSESTDYGVEGSIGTRLSTLNSRIEAINSDTWNGKNSLNSFERDLITLAKQVAVDYSGNYLIQMRPINGKKFGNGGQLTVVERPAITLIDVKTRTAYAPASAPDAKTEVNTSPRDIGAGQLSTAYGANPRNQYEMRYRVVDAFEAIASNRPDGSVNPNYLTELQERGRGKVASQDQINRITTEFYPQELLFDFHVLDRGTPIVGSDMMVESGNGRTMAIQNVIRLRPQAYAEYRQLLTERVGNFGLSESDLAGIDHPFLVRERLTPVDRVAFAQEANALNKLGMSPWEVARRDSRLIPDSMIDWLDISETGDLFDELLAPKNARVVNAYLDTLSPNVRGEVLSEKGTLNKAGVERIIAAMTARIYNSEAGYGLLKSEFETPIDGGRNLINALFDSFKDVSALEQAVRRGEIDGEYSIHEDVAQAMNTLFLVRTASKSMREVEGYIQMRRRGSDFFESTDPSYVVLTPFQLDVMEFFVENLRSRGKVDNVLKEWSRGILAGAPNLQQMSMFEMGDPITKEQAFYAAQEKVTGKTAPTTIRATDNQAGRGTGLQLDALSTELATDPIGQVGDTRIPDTEQESVSAGNESVAEPIVTEPEPVAEPKRPTKEKQVQPTPTLTALQQAIGAVDELMAQEIGVDPVVATLPVPLSKTAFNKVKTHLKNAGLQLDTIVDADGKVEAVVMWREAQVQPEPKTRRRPVPPKPPVAPAVMEIVTPAQVPSGIRGLMETVIGTEETNRALEILRELGREMGGTTGTGPAFSGKVVTLGAELAGIVIRGMTRQFSAYSEIVFSGLREQGIQITQPVKSAVAGWYAAVRTNFLVDGNPMASEMDDDVTILRLLRETPDDSTLTRTDPSNTKYVDTTTLVSIPLEAIPDLDTTRTDTWHRERLNKEGASNLNTPASVDPETVTEGMWYKDDKPFAYGHDVYQIQWMDANQLNLKESPMQEGRAEYVLQYEQWLQEGKVPPPVVGTVTPKGVIGIGDGNRRSTAARRAGAKIPVAISDITQGRSGLDVGLTYEIALFNAYKAGIPVSPDAMRQVAEAVVASRNAATIKGQAYAYDGIDEMFPDLVEQFSAPPVAEQTIEQPAPTKPKASKPPKDKKDKKGKAENVEILNVGKSALNRYRPDLPTIFTKIEDIGEMVYEVGNESVFDVDTFYQVTKTVTVVEDGKKVKKQQKIDKVDLAPTKFKVAWLWDQRTKRAIMVPFSEQGIYYNGIEYYNAVGNDYYEEQGRVVGWELDSDFPKTFQEKVTLQDVQLAWQQQQSFFADPDERYMLGGLVDKAFNFIAGTKTVPAQIAENVHADLWGDTLYVNNEAMLLIMAARGRDSTVRGVSYRDVDVPTIISMIRELRVPKSAQPRVDALVTALQRANEVTLPGEGIAIVNMGLPDSADERDTLIIQTRSHEWFHVGQQVLNYQGQHITQSGMEMLSQWQSPTSNWRNIALQLRAKGYPADTRILIEEASAFIAAGQWEQLGLSREDAKAFLLQYMRVLEFEYGPDAISVFNYMTDFAQEVRSYASQYRQPSQVSGSLYERRGSRIRPTIRPDVSGIQERYALDRTIRSNGRPATDAGPTIKFDPNLELSQHASWEQVIQASTVTRSDKKNGIVYLSPEAMTLVAMATGNFPEYNHSKEGIDAYVRGIALDSNSLKDIDISSYLLFRLEQLRWDNVDLPRLSPQVGRTPIQSIPQNVWDKAVKDLTDISRTMAQSHPVKDAYRNYTIIFVMEPKDRDLRQEVKEGTKGTAWHEFHHIATTRVTDAYGLPTNAQTEKIAPRRRFTNAYGDQIQLDFNSPFYRALDAVVRMGYSQYSPLTYAYLDPNAQNQELVNAIDEVVARITEGRYAELGLSTAEATGILSAFYDMVIELGGQEALALYAYAKPSSRTAQKGAVRRATNTSNNNLPRSSGNGSITTRTGSNAIETTAGGDSVPQGRLSRAPRSPRNQGQRSVPNFDKWFNGSVVTRLGQPLELYATIAPDGTRVYGEAAVAGAQPSYLAIRTPLMGGTVMSNDTIDRALEYLRVVYGTNPVTLQTYTDTVANVDALRATGTVEGQSFLNALVPTLGRTGAIRLVRGLGYDGLNFSGSWIPFTPEQVRVAQRTTPAPAPVVQQVTQITQQAAQQNTRRGWSMSRMANSAFRALSIANTVTTASAVGLLGASAFAIVGAIQQDQELAEALLQMAFNELSSALDSDEWEELTGAWWDDPFWNSLELMGWADRGVQYLYGLTLILNGQNNPDSTDWVTQQASRYSTLTASEQDAFRKVLYLGFSGDAAMQNAYNGLLSARQAKGSPLTQLEAAQVLADHTDWVMSFVGETLFSPWNWIGSGMVLGSRGIKGTRELRAANEVLNAGSMAKVQDAIRRAQAAVASGDGKELLNIMNMSGRDGWALTPESKAAWAAHEAMMDAHAYLVGARDETDLWRRLAVWLNPTSDTVRLGQRFLKPRDISDLNLATVQKAVERWAADTRVFKPADYPHRLTLLKAATERYIADLVKNTVSDLYSGNQAAQAVNRIEKISAFQKRALNNLLLRANLGFMATNFMGNVSTQAVDGVLGVGSKAGIQRFWQDTVGAMPEFIREGYSKLGIEATDNVETLASLQVYTAIYQHWYPELWNRGLQAMRTPATALTRAQSDDLIRVLKNAWDEGTIRTEVRRWAGRNGIASSRSVIREAIEIHRKTANAALAAAHEARGFTLIHYWKKYGWDSAMALIFPYHHWVTRSMMNWTVRLADSPAAFAFYGRYSLAMRDGVNRDEQDPDYLRRNWSPANAGQVRTATRALNNITNGIVPSDLFTVGMEDDERLYLNVIDKLLPLEQVYGLLPNVGFKRDLPEGASPISQIVDTLSQYPAALTPALGIGLAAYRSANGPDSVDPELLDNLVLLPLYAARPLQSATAALGIGGPEGINLDAPYRRMMGLPGNQEYELVRARKFVTDAVQQGLITENDGFNAIATMEGPVWDEALRQATRFYGDRGLVSAFTGFLPRTEPQDEQADWRKGLTEVEELYGSDSPQAEAYRAANPGADVGRISTRNTFISKELEDEAGQPFTLYSAQEAANRRLLNNLSPYSRNALAPYDARQVATKDQYATWARDAYQLLRTPEEKARVQLQAEMYRDRALMFPTFTDIQEQYFDLPDNQQKAFLKAHPELQQAWDFETEFRKRHLDLFPLTEQESVEDARPSIGLVLAAVNSGLDQDLIRQMGTSQLSDHLDSYYRDLDTLKAQYPDLDGLYAMKGQAEATRTTREFYKSPQGQRLQQYWDKQSSLKESYNRRYSQGGLPQGLNNNAPQLPASNNDTMSEARRRLLGR